MGMDKERQGTDRVSEFLRCQVPARGRDGPPQRRGSHCVRLSRKVARIDCAWYHSVDCMKSFLGEIPPHVSRLYVGILLLLFLEQGLITKSS
jgi:hypothetical protein